MTLKFADAAEEVEAAREALEVVGERVKSSAESRRLEFETLQAEQREAYDAFTSFESTFDRCVQELSMSEGLGQRYGAPRRNCQERLRTEMGRSDSRQANLDGVITKILSLISS